MHARFPDDDMMKSATVLSPAMWPIDTDERVLYGDREVAKLAKDAGISVRKLISSVTSLNCNLYRPTAIFSNTG